MKMHGTIFHFICKNAYENCLTLDNLADDHADKGVIPDNPWTTPSTMLPVSGTRA